MVDLQLRYVNQKLSKWLLTTAFIVCSIFFSGYSETVRSFRHQPLHTELVWSPGANRTRRTVLYNTAPLHNYKSTIFYSTFFSIVFSSILKVKFNCISKLFDIIKSPAHFICLKIIPQNSDEGIAILIA
jgi:hypothetical protein